MTFLVSYAQNFEDVLLWRAVGDAGPGVYVDVGAQSPDVDSVSRLFFERGWRGIHVEPVPEYAQALRDRRPGDTIVQAAVGAARGLNEFHVFADTGLSTLDSAVARSHVDAGFEEGVLQVATVTLDDVLAKAGAEVQWLKIDVEGAESAVIEGWRGDVRPWIVVVEATRPMSQDVTHHAWEPGLLSRGYTFALFDGLNRFYVADAHLDRLPRLDHGACVFDGFALGAESTAPLGAMHRAAVQHLEDALAREREAHQHVEALLQAAQADAAAMGGELASVAAVRDAAQADLATIRQSLGEAEANRDALRAEVAAARHAVVAVEAHRDALLVQLASTRHELSQVGGERDALRSEVEATRHSLEQAQAAYDASRHALTDAETRHSREVAALSERHAERLASQAAALERAELRHAEERAQLAAERGEVHARNEGLVRDVQWLRAELSVQRDRTLDAVDDARRWQAMAQARALELTAVYGSTSWRATAPLRAARLGARRIKALVMRTGQRIRWTSRAALTSIVRFAGQWSWVRRFGAVTLAPFPTLERRARRALYGPVGQPVAVLPVPTAAPVVPITQESSSTAADDTLSPYANVLSAAMRAGTRNA
jgi:FkbM family methyltransferase